jgi:GNAT superfamily N-acetyltransferase
VSLAARIALGQLIGLARSKTVVPAGPFTGLLTPGGHPMLSYAVAARPGEPITDLADSLTVLRAAFPENGLRFELINQACPGAVELLEAAGLTITARVPVMVADPDTLTIPNAPDGVTVDYIATPDDHTAANAIAHAAFGMPGEPSQGTQPNDPVDGGSVLARWHGKPVAVASWTPVAAGTTEIVGIATAEPYRRRGLGALVTAHAVRVAAGLGVTLPWLTPGDDDAGRVYAQVGFAKVADAVHLADRSPRP